MRFAVLAHQGSSLSIRQIFNALLRAEMEFDPKAFVLCVDKAESVRTKTMHMAIAGGDAAIRHDDGDLVQRLGQQGPKIPVVFGAAQIGARVAFDGMVQIRKLQRIAQEEHRRVIARQIPIALFGIELDGKTANIALGVGCAAFACHGRKAHEQIGLFAHLAKDFGAGVFGNIVRDRECAVSARAFGMHAAFRNHLAVKMRQFFEKPHILQKLGTTRASRHDILVIDHGATCGRG